MCEDSMLFNKIKMFCDNSAVGTIRGLYGLNEIVHPAWAGEIKKGVDHGYFFTF
jgi:hypothetical protein